MTVPQPFGDKHAEVVLVRGKILWHPKGVVSSMKISDTLKGKSDGGRISCKVELRKGVGEDLCWVMFDECFYSWRVMGKGK